MTTEVASEAASEVVPVSVVPGVWRLSLPMKTPPGHINSWLIEDGDSWLVVDCGIRSKEVRAIWKAFMASPLYRKGISRIFLTHAHPDHLGSAAWLARETSAPVLMAEEERQAMVDLAVDAPQRSEEVAQWLRRWDASDNQIAQCQLFYQHFAEGCPLISSQIEIVSAGHSLHVGGRAWQLHAGLGHTPCNILLYQPEGKLLITGDQILPDIVTNVSTWWRQSENPLALYLDSLLQLEKLDVTLALPAHGDPFSDYRARCMQLRDTHARRLELLMGMLNGGERSVAGLLQELAGRAVHTPYYLLVAGQVFARIAYLLSQGAIVERMAPEGHRVFSLNATQA